MGNGGVLILRLVIEGKGLGTSHRMLITNLCVADLIMGFYLAIIGIADVRFLGE